MIEFLTALLVIITAFYAWVTYKMLKANERVVETMRNEFEAMQRPYITITPFLEPDNPIFYLRIANTGKSTATDLSLKIDRSFFKFGERLEKNDLALFSIFNNKINAFPPNSEILFSLAQSFVIFQPAADPTLCPTRFTITASYQFGGTKIEEAHLIDLTPYLHTDIPQDPTIRKLTAINESLIQISKLMDK